MNQDKSKQIAFSLWRDVHSYARENIISSLLTASLNESETFRKWLMKTVKMNGHILEERMHAMASCPFPKNFLSKQKVFTDLMLWNCNYDNEWYDFETLNGKFDHLYGLYIEVKHTWLSTKDAKKYAECANSLLKFNKKKKHFFYAVISSHYKKELEALLDTDNKTINAINWKNIRDGGNLKHILLEEIHEEITNKNYESESDHYILPIFANYLDLLYHPENEVRWISEFEYYQKSKLSVRKKQTELKSAVYSAIREIARASGISDKGMPREPKYLTSIILKDNEKLGSIKTIENHTDLTVKFETGAHSKSISFKEIIKNINDENAAKEISKNLSNLSKIFERIDKNA
jgi:hypothetical protein